MIQHFPVGHRLKKAKSFHGPSFKMDCDPLLPLPETELCPCIPCHPTAHLLEAISCPTDLGFGIMTTFGHWAKVTVCWLQALFFFGVGRESQKEPGPGGCISFGLDEGSVAAL